jgi:hypothetical protein
VVLEAGICQRRRDDPNLGTAVGALPDRVEDLTARDLVRGDDEHVLGHGLTSGL